MRTLIVKNLTAAGIASRARAHRAVLDGLVAKMHADYMKPMTLHAVGTKYKRTHGCVRELFTRRGLYVRPFKQIARQPNGSPVRYVPFTAEQLAAMIAKATTFRVPTELKFEWRSWSLERRGQFVAQLRASMKRAEDRPELPFSSNVEPFDYSSAGAHAVAKRMNAGRDSRTANVSIHVVSQGVIYKDTLYFWAADGGGRRTGAYYLGPYRRSTGRPALHHVIWKEATGCAVPRGHVLRMIDRNPNNLVAENMQLATRNDVLREVQAAALARKSRQRTALILQRSQKPIRHDLSDTLLASRR